MANTSRAGAAGAYYTAAQLSQRGWDASLTVGNTPRTDIVAQHANHQRLIAVQCKARIGPHDFILSKGCESTSPPGRDEWFVLINLLDPGERPAFYVMPRNVLAAYLYVSHRAWLRGTNRDGTARRDNNARNVQCSVAAPYRERWDLLEQPVDHTPAWLPDSIFRWATRTGLPNGHPGLLVPSDGVERPAGPAWLAAPTAQTKTGNPAGHAPRGGHRCAPTGLAGRRRTSSITAEGAVAANLGAVLLDYHAARAPCDLMC